MHYQSFYKFYRFGASLRFLQDATTRYPVHGGAFTLHNIRLLFNFFEDLNLIVTNRLAHTKLDALVEELEATDKSANLTQDQVTTLKATIKSIRDTLDEEIKGIGAYAPTPKRINLDRLLDDVTSLFAPSTYDILPDLTRFDFQQAGRCIAFELPTAAAFHILRATEGCLRFYYERMVKSGRIKGRMWGPIVNDLRKRNITKKNETLNNHLDNIRASFRNPTQHPEATYDIHEVQDLWSVCIDVVNRMIRILRQENRL